MQLFEVVRRGGNRAPGSWIGVVSVNESDESLKSEILSEALAQFNSQIHIVDVHGADPFQLAQELQSQVGKWVLLRGFDTWSPENWHSAELNRNTWLREAGLNWFLFGPTAVSNISRYAPNIRSLIGPYNDLSPEDSQMSEAERHSRLAQLRDHYGKTDEQVIADAVFHNLEMTPHMVEWLILLDRGDLV